MQRLADLLDAPVDRPMIQETTVLGTAYLAGLAADVYPEPSKFADNWRLEHRFKPNMSQATRERKLAGWARAVKGVLAGPPRYDFFLSPKSDYFAAFCSLTFQGLLPPVRDSGRRTNDAK